MIVRAFDRDPTHQSVGADALIMAADRVILTVTAADTGGLMRTMALALT